MCDSCEVGGRGVTSCSGGTCRAECADDQFFGREDTVVLIPVLPAQAYHRGVHMTLTHCRSLRILPLLGLILLPACDCDNRYDRTFVPNSVCVANPNATPNHEIDVPMRSQVTDYFCSAASVQMWEIYASQVETSQSAIWQYMYDRWGSDHVKDPIDGEGPYGLVNAHPLVDAVNHFAYDIDIAQTSQTEWKVDEYVESVDDAISSQAAALNHAEPTIAAINNQTHFVVVKGGYWEKLPTEQPCANFMVYQDPYDGANKNATISAWRILLGSSGLNVGARYSLEASQGLYVYNANGGTYYGDPDPPECEHGDCLPIITRVLDRLRSVWAGLIARPDPGRASRTPGSSTTATPALGNVVSVLDLANVGQRQVFVRRHRGPERRASGPRRYIYVPHPYTTRYDEIIGNCLTGLRQSGMDRLAGVGRLVNDSSVSVGWIHHVSSLIEAPDYYLLTFRDADGRPYAVAAVSDAGWLLEAATLQQADGFPDDAEAIAVAARHGRPGGLSVKWLLVPAGSAGSTDFLSPLAEVIAGDGEATFVNVHGEAFEQSASGDIAVSPATAAPFKLRRLKTGSSTGDASGR